MTHKGRSTPRGASDLRVIRGSTVATLWVMVIISGVMQLLLGLENPVTPRMAMLAAATIAAVPVALAVVPLLLSLSVGPAARHPLVLTLLALAAGIWALAVVAPFEGWAWAFTLTTAGGMFSCLVRGWWKAVVILGTYFAIGVGGFAGTMWSPAAVTTSASAYAGADYIVISNLVVFTLMPLSLVWVLRVVLRLDQARKDASQLAVAKERLRFATDLHDIQGHNLQVIALKSELAERLLSVQPERAAAEIADIRGIAKAALDDTRAVVNDYRTVTVAVEARNAASVLRAAGISCAANINAPGMSTSIGAVFAVAIREAATNVLRHSKATEAAIDLILVEDREYRLTVTNNGSGAPRQGGTGLSGLADRVSSREGTVETARRNDTFTLVVRVPVPSDESHLVTI